MEKTAIILAAIIVAASCGPVKHITNTTSQKIEVKESVTFVPYLVKIGIPEIKETIRTRDTSSHLENKYAYSDAFIHSDGTLEHTLATKPQNVSQIVSVPTIQKDSIVYIEKEVERTVEVEKPLTKWQTFRLNAFWFLILIPIVLLIGLFAKKRLI